MTSNTIATGCILSGPTLIIGVCLDISLNLSHLLSNYIWHALALFVGVGLIAIGIAFTEDDTHVARD